MYYKILSIVDRNNALGQKFVRLGFNTVSRVVMDALTFSTSITVASRSILPPLIKLSLHTQNMVVPPVLISGSLLR